MCLIARRGGGRRAADGGRRAAREFSGRVQPGCSPIVSLSRRDGRLTRVVTDVPTPVARRETRPAAGNHS